MRASNYLLALVISSSVVGFSNPPAPERLDARLTSVSGRWTGTAEIDGTWTDTRTIKIELTIDSTQRVKVPDGSPQALRVKGRIGDAELLLGELRPNRGTVKRVLRMNSDLILESWLKGPVIATEEIRRGAVQMPLNLENGELVGSLATTGSSHAGREQMPITVARLVLHRE
jgi:hypothetical protein